MCYVLLLKIIRLNSSLFCILFNKYRFLISLGIFSPLDEAYSFKGGMQKHEK